MSNTGVDLTSDTMVLSLEDCQKDIPGFKQGFFSDVQPGQYAKALASAFLKFTAEGRRLSQLESVQNFIALAELHRRLTEQARLFLQEEVSFVYEDQQLHPLLLNFAAYRLKQASRQFYFAALQNQSELSDLKAQIQQCQSEYDALLQMV